MKEMQRLQRLAVNVKETYPPGTRIYLNQMNDPISPVPTGTRGTVDLVDSIGQIHMSWDNGRTLALVPGIDSFRKLTPQELEEEKEAKKPDLNEMLIRASSRLKKQARQDMENLDKQISFNDPER